MTHLETELKKYKDLHTNYIDNLVMAHNYHFHFIKNVTLDAGIALRKHLRRMIKLEKQMMQASMMVYKAQRLDKKEKLELRKQLRDQKKGPLRGIKRPKGKLRGIYNRTNQNKV